MAWLGTWLCVAVERADGSSFPEGGRLCRCGSVLGISSLPVPHSWEDEVVACNREPSVLRWVERGCSGWALWG